MVLPLSTECPGAPAFVLRSLARYGGGTSVPESSSLLFLGSELSLLLLTSGKVFLNFKRSLIKGS